MSRRLLITSAGTSGSENLIRSLRLGDDQLHIVTCSSDRFLRKNASADRSYLVPPLADTRFPAALQRIVDAERIDLVIPTTDAEVVALSELRARIPGRTLLPDADVIRLCQDKYDLTLHLRLSGVPAPETYLVTDADSVEAVFARFGGRPLWCRPRAGSCARGAGLVRNPEEARRWLLLWQEMRGLPISSFTLSEYLPGRDLLCQSVWRDGTMILANTFERLSYFGVDNIPSGITSLSSLAKTVVDRRIIALCREAIRAITPSAFGVFSIDLKEDCEGAPHITEINAGRFFMSMSIFDRVLKHNMPLIYVRLALGEPVELREEYDAVDGYYFVRDLDTLPGVFHAEELMEESVP